MRTNRKCHKSEFELSQTSLILFNFSSFVGKFSEVESGKTLSRWRKRKREILCCVHLLHKAGVSIRKFQVVVVQRRLKNMYKKGLMPVQSCCFTVRKLLLFSRSRCRRRRCCLSSLLLWSTNFVTMVTWNHTSSLYARFSRPVIQWFYVTGGIIPK